PVKGRKRAAAAVSASVAPATRSLYAFAATSSDRRPATGIHHNAVPAIEGRCETGVAVATGDDLRIWPDLETHLLQRAAVLLCPATSKKNSRAIDLLRQLSKNRAQTLGRGEPEVRSRQFPLLKKAKLPSRGVCA